MYGLVNKAIRDLIVENFGTEKWSEICRISDFPDEEFVAMSPYPDALTYTLVGNASKVLGADASVLLDKFGEYWVLYTANEGYGDLLSLSGNNLAEFLGNMDMLHNRIAGIMPDLKPPKFRTRNQQDRSIELEYYSHREGLTPMIFGLIRGLGKRFGQECTIEQIQERKSIEDCHVFKISW
ncbi:MAG: heme NO-binding domain-containing protein [Bacteroidota bacterium]